MNEAVTAAEYAQLKKENQRQQDIILQLTRELDAFTYSVSHDLRAPLRAVTGFTRILEEDYKNVLDKEGLRLLNTVSVNAGRMGALIDGLLVFSRTGRRNVEPKATDMNNLADAVIQEISRGGIGNAKIRVSSLHPIDADPALMRQVLTNLVANAIKFSSKKKTPLIEITSVLASGEVTYSVKDNGVGFDMRYADKLFGLFQRLHTVEEFEGAGIGLAVVQRIVSKHGGRTWIEAIPDEGTTTYFSIPISK